MSALFPRWLYQTTGGLLLLIFLFLLGVFAAAYLYGTVKHLLRWLKVPRETEQAVLVRKWELVFHDNPGRRMYMALFRTTAQEWEMCLWKKKTYDAVLAGMHGKLTHRAQKFIRFVPAPSNFNQTRDYRYGNDL